MVYSEKRVISVCHMLRILFIALPTNLKHCLELAINNNNNKHLFGKREYDIQRFYIKLIKIKFCIKV